MATGAEYWLTLHMVPLAADLTRVELRMRTMPLSNKAKAAFVVERVAHTALAKFTKRTMSTDQITAEDRRAAEAIQQAMSAPNFAVGAMPATTKRRSASSNATCSTSYPGHDAARHRSRW